MNLREGSYFQKYTIVSYEKGYYSFALHNVFTTVVYINGNNLVK